MYRDPVGPKQFLLKSQALFGSSFAVGKEGDNDSGKQFKGRCHLKENARDQYMLASQLVAQKAKTCDQQHHHDFTIIPLIAEQRHLPVTLQTSLTYKWKLSIGMICKAGNAVCDVKGYSCSIGLIMYKEKSVVMHS